MAALKTRTDCAITFDHHGPAFAADPIGTLNAAREVCPIAWSGSHGGFWLVTGYPEAFDILQDDATFSSASGVSVPPLKKKGPPIDVDPPAHRVYRRALGPDTSPGGAARLTADIEVWAAEAVDAVIESGSADLIQDLGAPVPARAIMKLLGLEMTNWRRYAHVWHELFAHPLRPEVYDDLATVRAEVRDTFAAARGCPADDLMGHLWTNGFFDELRPHCPAGLDEVDEGSEIAMTLLGAGVDTTTNLFGSTVLWLSQNPAHRQRLVDDPGLLPRATDEFLRYFSPAPALARVLTRDLDFHRHELRAGERILVAFMGANHDPRAFDRPEEIVLDRWPNKHMAFGVGIHRCVGSNLARVAFPIMLGAVLDRMPDYAVRVADCEMYEDRGQVTGWSAIPCTFTPRARTGAVAG